ncbi:cAMP-responsive element modulator-like [Micropterus salmoides]|uniref:cAMP-responsive element modulator-like n=1 Tax=Micropterus salmoides TaxID=27706 RepID=UPI0018EA48DB|nr:cAMP-responsive element modulator-like [Micropterus salmoides]XP_038560830.1 cAMP-responsive element modulator-like [Micropterus salmoides]
MNQVKTDDKYQPRAPVPGIHALVYQQNNHNQCYGFFQEGHVKFLPVGTQNLPSMAVTRPQTPQSLSSTLRYYREGLNCPQNYCVPPLPAGFSQGGPARSLPNWTQNLSSIAMTSTQAPQPPPRTLEYNWNRLEGPQNNVRGKTLKGTVSLGEPGSRYSMAVTGDETETGTAGDMTACQLRNPSSSLPQGVAEASAHSSHKPIEDALQKREHRLMKNREAARECRRKKKEYVKCLENRVAVLENQNKTLIEELRALKDIYRHKAE